MRALHFAILSFVLTLTPCANAQRAPASSSATGTMIVTLGTAGGPRPRIDRGQAANLIIANGELYLIDVGEGTIRRIVQAGFDFTRVGRVFITHGHSDHTLGLPALLATQWEFQRRLPVLIFGPEGTERLVHGALDFLEVNSAIRATEGVSQRISEMVLTTDVSPGLVYRDANVTVTAVENTHFNFPVGSPAYGRFKSYSYRFDTPGRSVVFTGDTGVSPALEKLARGADVLVTEINSVDDMLALYKQNGTWQRKTPEERASWMRHQVVEHLSPSAVGELAKSSGVKMVVLTHFTPTVGMEADYVRWANEVRAEFKGDVRVAKDLDRF